MNVQRYISVGIAIVSSGRVYAADAPFPVKPVRIVKASVMRLD